MKLHSPAMAALLATGQVKLCNLYTIKLIDGTLLRYADADVNITANGFVYNCGGFTGPFFNLISGNGKPQLNWKAGTQVDTMTIDVTPGDALVEGAPFLTYARWGGFDGAEFIMERVPMPSYGATQAGTIIVFVGRVAEVDAGRTMATFTINSHLELLNQNMPRSLYQSSCRYTLFDGGCTLLKASFSVSGTISTGSTGTLLNATGLSNVTGYFDLGSISFTSGVNEGFARTVKAYVHGSPSTINLTNPFGTPPSSGDTFTIYPGCDKTQATCQNKFSNLLNFGGMPFVPAAETAT